MSDLHNRSSARRTDYVWKYEYYDDDELVSFEGLKAHRYSIVIGFWVGLAVFVVFMFFVLTLLTKTGAPHQENPDSAEKHLRPGSCPVDIAGPQGENDKAFFRPLLAESRYFHCFIGEESQGKERLGDESVGKHVGAQGQRGTGSRARGLSSSGTGETDEDVAEAAGRRPLGGPVKETDKDGAFFSHFNIPNFVNLEHGSTLGEDDLLYEPSVILESRSP